MIHFLTIAFLLTVNTYRITDPGRENSLKQESTIYFKKLYSCDVSDFSFTCKLQENSIFENVGRRKGEKGLERIVDTKTRLGCAFHVIRVN